MTPGAHLSSRRIRPTARILPAALALVLANVICAVALAAPARAADGERGHGTHTAAAIHKQVGVVHRADTPDAIIAPAALAGAALPDERSAPLVETDSSSTASSTRTRDPPVKADRYQPTPSS